MRFGRRWIRRRNFANQREHRALVLLLRKELIQLHENVGDAVARQRSIGKHLLDARAKLVIRGTARNSAFRWIGRKRRQHPFRPLGGGIEL